VTQHRAGAQFIVLDPVGKWWGLRLAADGKAPGIPIPVFGGLHGDIPLESTAGKMVADLIADRAISVVLDVSQFESDAAKARFASDFADRFFFRKKAQPSACHLFLEEAQEFVPQNPQRDEATMLHRFTRYVKLGRNFGLGCSLISQRPQEVNKKVLNQTELLFAFQMTGPQERKTVEGWIAEKGIDEDIAAELPKLRRGAPHVWSPAWLQVSKVVQIRPKQTFDASSTPQVGARAVESQPLAPVDLEKIRKDMAATIEKAKAEDPKLLRQEIATLRAQLGKASKGESVRTETTIQKVEVPVLRPEELHRLEEAISGAMDAQQTSREASQALAAAVAGVGQLLDSARQIAARAAVAPRPVSRPVAQRPAPTVRTEASGDLNRGERLMLTAIAQYPSVSTETLAVLTGYKRSSRATYLQKLRAAGYITGSDSGVTITAEGVQALGDFEPLPTGEALQEYWREKLDAGEKRLFEAILDAYPRSVTNEKLESLTGYKRSSVSTYLQKLRSRRIVERVVGGESRASEELFA
jgi:hypothetical protein